MLTHTCSQLFLTDKPLKLVTECHVYINTYCLPVCLNVHMLH